jgi:quercetin dioxygenase-like cupin family protein
MGPEPAVEVRVVEGGGQAGWLSVVESVLGEGFALPFHVHHREDVVVRVLEGELRVYQEGRERLVGVGDVVFLSRGKEHSLAVLQAPARVSVMFTPAGFEEAAPVLWEAGDPRRSRRGSLERLRSAVAPYGCEITGNPPRAGDASWD